MAVRLTSDPNSEVALYDTVEGWAFGPVFANQQAAEDFLDFVPGDIRLMSKAELESARLGWQAERGRLFE